MIGLGLGFGFGLSNSLRAGSSSPALDYYVSSDGDDGNNGMSTATPFATIAAAVAVATEGQTIALKGGDTFGENVVLTTGIILRSYFAALLGMPIIQPGSGDGIYSMNVEGISIQGLHLIGDFDTTFDAGWGIRFLNENGGTLNGFQVYNCEIEGFFLGAVAMVEDGISSIMEGVDFQNNYVHDCTFHGLGTYYANATVREDHFPDIIIRGNRVEYITGIVGVNSGNGVIVYGATGTNAGTTSATGLVDFNYINRCGYLAGVTAGGGPTGLLVVGSTGITIRYNISKRTFAARVPEVDGLGIDLDLNTTGCVVERNYTYLNEGAGYYVYKAGAGNVVRNNISVNDATLCQHSLDGKECAALFHNNTVIKTRGARPLASSDQASKFYNNIFLQAGASGPIIGEYFFPSFEGNLYFNRAGLVDYVVGTGIAAWRSEGKESEGGSPRGFETEPFINVSFDDEELDLMDPQELPIFFAMRTFAGSVAQLGGLDLQAFFGIAQAASDFNGNPITNPTNNIGCYITNETFSGPSVLYTPGFEEFTVSWPIAAGVTSYQVNLDSLGWVDIGLVGEYSGEIAPGSHTVQVRADGGTPTSVSFTNAYNGLPQTMFGLGKMFLSADELTLSDGDPVSSFPDSTGTFTVTQSNAGKRPAFETSGINSADSVLFSAGKCLSTAGNAGGQPQTLVMVAQPSSGDRQFMWVGNVILYAHAGFYRYFGSAGDVGTSIAVDGQPHVIRLVINGGRSRIIVDSTSQLINTGSADILGAAFLGGNDGVDSLIGHMAHASIWSTDINLLEMTIFNAYLAKWGSLP